jgi:hypothetical protein
VDKPNVRNDPGRRDAVGTTRWNEVEINEWGIQLLQVLKQDIIQITEQIWYLSVTLKLQRDAVTQRLIEDYLIEEMSQKGQYRSPSTLFWSGLITELKKRLEYCLSRSPDLRRQIGTFYPTLLNILGQFVMGLIRRPVVASSLQIDEPFAVRRASLLSAFGVVKDAFEKRVHDRLMSSVTSCLKGEGWAWEW